VGLVWLKDPGNAEQREKLIAAAHSFAREIPEVQFLSVGQTLPKRVHGLTLRSTSALSCGWKTKAAMDHYAKNPVHQKAAQEVFLPFHRKSCSTNFTSE